MAISKVKNYNVAPYYDDFSENDNYLRILFRPGVSVQARELTQLQTALQAQIDKLGQYNFQDGSRVLGGKATLNINYDYIKLEDDSSGALSAFVGTTITGGTSGVTALVLNSVTAEGSDADTLYIKYTNSGTDNVTNTFTAGEVISSNADTVQTATIGGGSGSSVLNPIGQGSAVDIEEGVYFIAGNMVHVPQETLILDKYTNTPSYIIGLQIEESVVTSADDTDLVDNALGSPNASAPGAHRYSISTTLIKEPLSLASRTVDDYILLMVVRGGVIEKLDTDKLDTELTARLARRTNEESGDYALSPFILDIKEHLNDEVSNNGYLTAARGGDEDKIALGIEPSVAYVQGYRVEKISTEYLDLDKPRSASDKSVKTAVTTSTGFGNYIKLDPTSVAGIPDINDLTAIDLRNSTTVIGSARARGFEHDSASPANFRLYLFDIVMNSGQVFADVDNVAQSSTSFAGDFLTGTEGTRFEVGNSSLVFKLPYNAIETLKTGNDNSADYVIRSRIAGGTVASGSSTFSLPSGTTLNDDDDVILFASGTTVPIADSQVSGVGTSTVTITGLGAYDGDSPFAIFNIKRNNVLPKTKTLQSDVDITIAYSFGTNTYDLGRYDIIKINSITDSNGTDVTDKFVLDNGQRENFYENGSVTLIGGTTLPAGNFVVNIDHFTHNQGDYFSVDSYPDYDEIPTFNSVNGVLELRDCLDFRPTKGYAGTTPGEEFSSGTSASNGNMIQPVGLVTTDITFYLGRIDKVFLTKDGSYRIVKGTSSLNPTEPENIEEALHLHTLYIRPYVFSVGDIKPVSVDNKRYTMRDIGQLDKRIKTLEYYSSLSLLERSAADTQLFDGSGFSRFKNGFVVDAFYGHNVGDVSHPDYNCAIDKSAGILRPKFDERNVNLVRKTGDTGTAVIHDGGIVTMPYTQVAEITQPYSSYAEFVNPYDVTIWDGTIKLSPESDEWKEVDKLPDIIINDNSLYDQFVAAAKEDGILGTVWNEWRTNWSGTPISSTVSSSENLIVRGAEGARLTGTVQRGGGALVTRITSTDTFRGTSTRRGIRTSIASDTVLKEVGNVVVEVNFIPFMRARKISFKAELLKPNTRVYPFFNGTDVSDYCRAESHTEFHTWRNTFHDRFFDREEHVDGSSTLVTDAAGKIEGTFMVPRNSKLKFKTGTREFKLTDDANNVDENATTTASENFFSQGVLETTQKTIVATKVPRLQRTQINDRKTITRTENQTRHELVRYIDPLAETFVIKTKGGVFATYVGLFFAQIDDNLPVTISIRTVENGIPTQTIVPGSERVVYPSEITTSADASVETEIDFDYPIYLQESVEYAIVIVSNSQKYKVYVAETGAYDLTNTNYRIIKQPYNGVFFTSQNASTWTPEQTKDLKFTLGRATFTGSTAEINLVNDSVAPKQLGADPLEFISNPTGDTCKIKVYHSNHGMYNPDNATSEHQVTISGASGTINGVASALINGTHDVNETEIDSYTITVGSSGTPAQAATLNVNGGGTTIVATENMIYNTLNIAAQTVEFKDAFIDYNLTGRTGSCPDPSAAVINYNNVAEFGVLANSNITLPVPYVIASEVNETARSIGKSFNIRAVLNNSGVENLSPVLDMNRTSAVTVMNRINDPLNNSTQYSDRGSYVSDLAAQSTSSLAKYITKKVVLNEEAELLDIYINANKPESAGIDVYYKVADDSSGDFDQIDWVLASPTNPIPTNNGGEYGEVHYEVEVGQSFDSFAVKIVLRSENSSSVPTVKDFRAIATI